MGQLISATFTLHTISMKIFLLLGFFSGTVHMHTSSLWPMSSVPMSSVPMSSVPVSSVPMSSVPVSYEPIHYPALSSGYSREKTVCQTISAELRCDCAACQFKESKEYQRNLCSACERCSEMGYPFTSPTSGFKHCSCIGGCSSKNGFLPPGHTYCVGCECSN